jgi:A/G-specific adenine glycosylase
MLQQTQVKTVIPYYDRFLERFQDIGSLARASEREIMTLWSGLGYYSRARNLLKAARQIVKAYNGVFPSEYKEILALPGVGRYTAGAICSLGFNQAQPVVDGNVRRVITRLIGIKRHAPDSFFWNQMTAWIPENNSSFFNQGMMELGALVCVPSTPRCPRCPVRNCCEALKMGLQDTIPRSRARQAARRVEIVILILERNDKILLTRQTRSLIPGEWGLPIQFLHDQESPQDAAARLMREILGSTIPARFLTELRHSISHHRILGHVFYAKAGRSIPQLGANSRFRWVSHPGLSAFLTSSLFRKALRKYGE